MCVNKPGRAHTSDAYARSQYAQRVNLIAYTLCFSFYSSTFKILIHITRSVFIFHVCRVNFLCPSRRVQISNRLRFKRYRGGSISPPERRRNANRMCVVLVWLERIDRLLREHSMFLNAPGSYPSGPPIESTVSRKPQLN